MKFNDFCWAVLIKTSETTHCYLLVQENVSKSWMPESFISNWLEELCFDVCTIGVISYEPANFSWEYYLTCVPLIVHHPLTKPIALTHLKLELKFCLKFC